MVKVPAQEPGNRVGHERQKCVRKGKQYWAPWTCIYVAPRFPIPVSMARIRITLPLPNIDGVAMKCVVPHSFIRPQVRGLYKYSDISEQGSGIWASSQNTAIDADIDDDEPSCPCQLVSHFFAIAIP